nr:MAG TPA: hypothetical protein [Caudoviricetes sp.]
MAIVCVIFYKKIPKSGLNKARTKRMMIFLSLFRATM